MLMFAVKIEKKSAEKTRRFLRQGNLIDLSFKPKSDESFVYFPLTGKPSRKQLIELKKLSKAFRIESIGFLKQKKKRFSFKELLEKKLSKKELAKLTRAFDVIGDIIIIELPESLEKKEKLIGRALLEFDSGARLACRKLGPHKGVYREEPVKIIAVRENASDSLQTIYKEHGVRMKVSLGKVFFSPRLATERKRIAGKVKKNEVVGVLFAGVGPFALVIARHAKPKKIIAIELNPEAVRLLDENIVLNGFQEVIEGIQGDVRKIIPKQFTNYFDRIAMPLPKSAESFLNAAFKGIKKNGVIHFYQFSDREKPFEKPVKLIEEHALKAGKKIKVIEKRVIREFSKTKVQAVIDFKVLN